MTRYFHKRTGAVIDTDCSLLGDWVVEGEVTSEEKPVEVKKVQEVEKPKEVTAATVSATDFDGITRPQIMQELDAFGIEYDKRANKQTLYDLMMSQGK